MQSIQDKISKRIYGNGGGWAFSHKDFIDLGSIEAIDVSLHRLEQVGKIRRVIRGLYDYPHYSKLLKCNLSPDIFQIAEAIGRKFKWRIQPTGAAALNRLNLSTQIPGRIVFLSDGPSRKYDVMGMKLEFKKTSLKDSSLQYLNSELLVQAIKALGRERIDRNIAEKIREHFNQAERAKILRDTQYVTCWIYEVIKDIFHEGNS